MDPFTHLLIGYLATFALWGPSGVQYVVAGGLAGGLPDADVLLFPLARRFPMLRHRGISHSIVGVTIIAAAGAFAGPPAFAYLLGPSFGVGSPLFFFVAMELGGLSHVLLDAIDHFAVPVFAPFSRKEYHLDADRIVNVGSMAFTVAAYGLMLYERGRTPIWVWEVTAWTLLGLAVVYLVVRLSCRWLAERVRRREGFADVIPQANPLAFLLVDETVDGDRVVLRRAMYHLGRGYLGPPTSLELSTAPGKGGPVAGSTEAMRRCYATALKESWVLREAHRFAEVTEAPGYYEVFWYSLEFTFLGRAAGVLARIDSASGELTTRSVWRAPTQPRRPPTLA